MPREEGKAPGQTHNVLRQLWNGDTLDRIYENLEMHGSASPTTSQLSDTSSQLQHVKVEPYSTPTQTPLCSPQILEYSNSARSHDPEISHIYRAIENPDSTTNCTKDELDGLMPHLETSIFSNNTLTNSIYEPGATDCTPTMPFGMFMEHNTPLVLPDAYYPDHTFSTDDVGNVNWWQPGISDPMLPDYAVSPSTNLNAWPYPQFTPLHLPSQAQDSHPQSVSTPSSITDKSPLISHSLPREKLRRSITSSTTSVGESQYPTPPPSKKRKLETSGRVSSTTASAGSQSKGNDGVSQENAANSRTSDQDHPSHDRERHRRASARNWQKQKQQTADLEAAMKIAESRNRELHREYAEVLSQVMNVKNALMDHTNCNHPAISSWLRSQATKYVLNKGAAVEKEQKDRLGAGDKGAHTNTAGRNPTICR
ncbi:hypothetical protein LZ30DRAFT_805493 [Colletotrichum cereale]|nr:hypothetical protein LZ30DRAFT_805493 [Colletotrichum cereale]